MTRNSRITQTIVDCINAGKFSDAVKHADLAHSNDPGSGLILYLRGQAKAEQGDFSGAERDLSRSAEQFADEYQRTTNKSEIAVGLASTYYWLEYVRYRRGDLEGVSFAFKALLMTHDAVVFTLEPEDPNYHALVTLMKRGADLMDLSGAPYSD